jgi:hypothetical protein
LGYSNELSIPSTFNFSFEKESEVKILIAQRIAKYSHTNRNPDYRILKEGLGLSIDIKIATKK